MTYNDNVNNKKIFVIANGDIKNINRVLFIGAEKKKIFAEPKLDLNLPYLFKIQKDYYKRISWLIKKMICCNASKCETKNDICKSIDYTAKFFTITFQNLDKNSVYNTYFGFRDLFYINTKD